MTNEVREKPEVVNLGRSKKVIVGFQSREADSMSVSISLSNDGCESLSLDSAEILVLAHYLKNPFGPGMIELSDGRCEKRDMWRALEVLDGQRRFVGYVCVCRGGRGIRLMVQSYGKSKTISSVRLTDVDVRVLIGFLYLCMSNKFLSLRTISDMIEDGRLHTDNIEINDIC